MSDESFDTQLDDCLATVKSLEDENQRLRASASSFADLAERLNAAMDLDRRIATSDRRQHPRVNPDRRRA